MRTRRFAFEIYWPLGLSALLPHWNWSFFTEKQWTEFQTVFPIFSYQRYDWKNACISCTDNFTGRLVKMRQKMKYLMRFYCLLSIVIGWNIEFMQNSVLMLQMDKELIAWWQITVMTIYWCIKSHKTYYKTMVQ